MTSEYKDHGEPPSFAKWLVWLFRKDTWKKQPYVALVASIIATSVALSAFYGAYQRISQEHSPPLKQAVLSLSALRFLEDNSNKIDVLIRNSGNTIAVVDKAVFTVHAVHVLSPNVMRSAALLSTENYVVEFAAEPTPYRREVPFHQSIEADKADRFQIEIVAENDQQGSEFVYEFSIDFNFNGQLISTDHILFMEVSPSRYLPPPNLDTQTHHLLKVWSKRDFTKSRKLSSLINEFGTE